MTPIDSCCGRPPREIRIDTEGSGLTFTICDRCERQQWFKDGQPVDIETVKATAAEEWNRKLRSLNR
jgi:hypothetical protein